MTCIHVDRDLCISAEVCVNARPDVFSLDAEQIAVKDDGAEQTLDDDERRDLALDCPSGALQLVDSSGTRIELD